MGEKCVWCGKSVYAAEKTMIEGKPYHNNCAIAYKKNDHAIIGKCSSCQQGYRQGQGVCSSCGKAIAKE